ncbi:MmgE/PrpD family protein [Enterovirga rhinocerotis]|uniref:2-methylcitrate dehydratase PrpD n=1 Tax=Enterovirga rhinocerotis TaxID=1339210 RepID=A0A4R7BQX7_9HYPH|nr:MmgE/PrpD family protein [Enterovirga rhinocerotis]TDR88070.1 2-methylcitrate dehydratase PrpD [Enterovirga rhinocerotis]
MSASIAEREPALAVPDLPAMARLARFVVRGEVAGPVLAKAVPIVLDTLAVTLAGGAEPGHARLAASLEPHPGGVPSFWSGARYRADDAALLIGMASHILDYDDVSMQAVCHPSAPILSALLAAADREATSGRDLLDAFVVGTEVLIRTGQAMGFRHYALGFHATATLGTLGATAAVARLRRLDEATTAHALAIAASYASGLRVNFGSLVKSLHVGMAAANGVRAVRLAEAGLEGAAEALDGEGYLNAFSGGETRHWPASLELGRPFALAEPGFEQKRYPCCYLLHKMIEAALGLRRETGLDLDSVAAMRVDVPQGGTKPLIHPYPKSGLNALFSAPYAIAASLADGRIDLASFTDEAVMRPALQARLRDVTVVEADAASRHGSDVGLAPVTVTLTPVSGASVSRTVVLLPGSDKDPITPDQLRAKWADCLKRAAPRADQAGIDALFDEGRGLPAAARIGDWLGAVIRTVEEGRA